MSETSRVDLRKRLSHGRGQRPRLISIKPPSRLNNLLQRRTRNVIHRQPLRRTYNVRRNQSSREVSRQTAHGFHFTLQPLTELRLIRVLHPHPLDRNPLALNALTQVDHTHPARANTTQETEGTARRRIFLPEWLNGGAFAAMNCQRLDMN